jgi:hypothetical protein
MKWAGRVTRMTETGNEYAVFVRSCHRPKTNHWRYHRHALPVFEQLNKYSKCCTDILISDLVLHWYVV